MRWWSILEESHFVRVSLAFFFIIFFFFSFWEMLEDSLKSKTFLGRFIISIFFAHYFINIDIKINVKLWGCRKSTKKSKFESFFRISPCFITNFIIFIIFFWSNGEKWLVKSMISINDYVLPCMYANIEVKPMQPSLPPKTNEKLMQSIIFSYISSFHVHSPNLHRQLKYFFVLVEAIILL